MGNDGLDRGELQALVYAEVRQVGTPWKLEHAPAERLVDLGLLEVWELDRAGEEPTPVYSLTLKGADALTSARRFMR